MIAPPVHYIYRPAHVRHVSEFQRLTVEHFSEPHPSPWDVAPHVSIPHVSGYGSSPRGKTLTGAPTLPKIPHRKIRIKHARVKGTRSK